MAINIKNFVDITSTFPAPNPAERAFGGLVFTTNTMPNMVGEDGKPVPKDANGLPYPKNAQGYYFVDAEGTPHNWVWDEENKLYYYKASSSADTLYPANSEAIQQYETYISGGLLPCSLDLTKTLFGVDADEYEFAKGYYGYISPTGRGASELKFAYVKSGETPQVAFKRVIEETNQFGSFTFLSVNNSGESGEQSALDSLREVASYNSSLDTKYLFVVNDKRGEQSAFDVVQKVSDGFSSVRGTCFVSGSSEVSAYMPMAILGATNFSAGPVPSYMFKQFATEKPTVKDDVTYSIFNKNFINFYGRTQSNGQTLDFYQRGFNTNGDDTTVYCNEMWFKAACENALVNLFVDNESLPANEESVSLVSMEVTNICQSAVENGAFLPRDVSVEDAVKIRQLVYNANGSENADDIISNISINGYAVFAYLSFARAENLSAGGEYIIHYYVFYGTGDSVRFIKGDDILVK